MAAIRDIYWRGVFVDPEMPQDVLEELFSLPGIGIVVARPGDLKGKTLDSAPALIFTPPRDGDIDRAQTLFREFSFVRPGLDPTFGRSFVEIYSIESLTEMSDPTGRQWWDRILSGLRSLALSEWPSLGPFTVCDFWVRDPGHFMHGSGGILMWDERSGISTSYGVELHEGTFSRAGTTCGRHRKLADALHMLEEDFPPDLLVSRPNCLSGLSLEGAVDSAVRHFEAIPGISKGIRDDLRFLLIACGQFAGAR